MTETTTNTANEQSQIDAANASGRRPVVFVHGLWLLAGSWQRWTDLFESRGYATVAVDWPGDAASVAEALADPQQIAGTKVGQVADHVAEVVGKLDRKPILIGHSFGGLLVQIVSGRGLAAATVAIDPAPFRGVLPLPVATLRSVFPVLHNPLNWKRAVALTPAQFRYGWTNTLTETESQELQRTFHVAAPGAPLFQGATANVNPWTRAKVNTKNPERGPVLIVAGEKDNTVPWAMAHAAYKRQKRNSALTEIVEMPNRGHSLIIDSGWTEVAETALEFLSRALDPAPATQ
ncbi:MAG: alpha/beta hydrolase [Sporichthyaceae bacterium]